MNPLTNHELLRIVAIFRGIKQQQVLDAAAVFVEAGIKAMEITYNTPGAAQF